MTATTAMKSNRRTATPLIEADNLRLGYGRRTVLDHVSLDIHGGEFWFFLGANGTGKSTLLKAILGVLPPQAGRLQSHVAAQQIGLVPQRCDFNSSLPTTVREFVQFGLVGLKVTREEARQRFDWALDHVDLAPLRDRNYWSLSGGQRQRALVARALVRRPSLLLADEPTNGLDLIAHNTLLDALSALHRSEKLAVVMIAHDLLVAARYCTHIALFHGGGVAAGPATTVFQPAQLQRIYHLPADVCEKIAGMADDRGGAADES